MPRWLLIDNSNTRTKFAIGGPERLDGCLARLPTADITPESLAELLDPLAFDATCQFAESRKGAPVEHETIRSEPGLPGCRERRFHGGFHPYCACCNARWR